MKTRSTMAAITIGATTIALLAVPTIAQAAAPGFSISVNTGDHFSKKYETYVYTSLRTDRSRYDTSLLIKGNGVTKRYGDPANVNGLTLRPGRYTAKLIAVIPPTMSSYAFNPNECRWRTATQTPWAYTENGWDTTRTRTTTGAMTCVSDATYTAPRMYTETQSRQSVGDPWKAHYTNEYWDDPIYDRDDAITMKRPHGRTSTLVIGRRTFTVKPVNGDWVSHREARAIRIGMPMSQVHHILGTAGRSGLKASGFSVRHYDGTLTIGYSNGTVDSIQRY